MRWFATFFATWTPSGKFTTKERMLMGFAWIPKATVQAAIGGIVLFKAKEEGVDSFVEYGTWMVTISVFAIILTAPTGAILTNTLGPMWLSKDMPPPTRDELEFEFKKNKNPYLTMSSRITLTYEKDQNDRN
jgi:hypothetical protein